MLSILKTLLVAVLLALVPLRAMAAVTNGFCAFAHEHGTAAHHGSDGHDPHDHDSAAHGHDASPCSSCIEHCSGAAFAPSARQVASLAAPAGERCFLCQRSTAGFIPEHLDPPPLAV